MRDLPTPPPWSLPRSNIPWDEPGFSTRMLAEHLNQHHDAASRKFEHIDRQVEWIHERLLARTPTPILDLGCGPGLYTERLAVLGHSCHGIDFGPASIEHARATARRDNLACSYDLHDLRTASFGEGHGLVTFLYGEPSVFSPEQLRSILARAAASLLSGGQLLLELHTEHGVAAMAEETTSDRQLTEGLFLDAPHRLMKTTQFDSTTRVATCRWVVEPSDGSPPAEHVVWYQAYSDEAFSVLLSECGFESESVTFRSNLLETSESPSLQFVTATRA